MQGTSTLVHAMMAHVASATCLVATITCICRAVSSHLVATFLKSRVGVGRRENGRKEESGERAYDTKVKCEWTKPELVSHH